MACGNNKATRSMVVSYGGVAVSAALAAEASRREALARVVGRQAVAIGSGDYFVLRDGTRTHRTRTPEDRDQHVHVVVGHRGDPNSVMLQVTDRTRVEESYPWKGRQRGHFERTEIQALRGTLAEADIQREASALVAKMNARIARSRKR